jgi:hypothetical protein
VIPLTTDHERDGSSSSESSRLYPPPPKPSSSPIGEEDEDQLPPLPNSPRRPSCGSPAHSPSISPSPSPNPSMSCLEPGLRSSSHDTPLSSAFGSDKWAPKQTDGILLARNWMCYGHPFVVRVHVHIRIDDRTCFSALCTRLNPTALLSYKRFFAIFH